MSDWENDIYKYQQQQAISAAQSLAQQKQLSPYFGLLGVPSSIQQPKKKPETPSSTLLLLEDDCD